MVRSCQAEDAIAEYFDGLVKNRVEAKVRTGEHSVWGLRPLE